MSDERRDWEGRESEASRAAESDQAPVEASGPRSAPESLPESVPQSAESVPDSAPDTESLTVHDTQPVDLDNTLPVDLSSAPQVEAQAGPSQIPGPVWSYDDLSPAPDYDPYALTSSDAGYAGAGYAGGQHAAADAGYQQPWYDPQQHQWSEQQNGHGEQADHFGQPALSGQPDAAAPNTGPVQPSSAATRHTPGWTALIGVAATSALIAGTLGGLGGGWLASNGYLDLSRSTYSAPKPGAGSTTRPDGSVASIAARALPSVVTIKVTGADGSPGTGSGFVFDQQGHIITNNHVVAEAANERAITVQLSNGKHVEATLVGRDASYDIAVLKTTGTGLVALPLAASSSVVVGDQVIAVGAPLGLDSTVTTGIVSALNRPVSPGGGDDQSFINAIQTDAAINPGNSGGPLLDMQGRVIGVNSAIARVPGTTSEQSGNIGVGFSIPSDQVRKTAEQLIRSGKAEHPVIGVILDRTYEGEGVKIAATGSGDKAPITKGGPADKAGLKAGDVIIEFDGRPMTNPDDLVVAIRAKNVGDRVALKVRRGNREVSVRMTLTGSSE